MPVLFHVGTIDASYTNVDPNTLNLDSNGKFITAFVMAPALEQAYEDGLRPLIEQFFPELKASDLSESDLSESDLREKASQNPEQ